MSHTTPAHPYARGTMSRYLLLTGICNILLLAFAATEVVQAETVSIPICYDYGCKSRGTASLNGEQWRTIRRLFLPSVETPVEERRRIATAVARLESLAGRQIGTTADLGGNATGAGEPGQMDCIDESTNTTTYLRLLQDDGLLRWHTVLERRMRNKWIFDVHWAAVIEELDNGEQYAVDSWFFENGREPVINPLEDWLANRGDPDYP
ncbi:MAG: hypothetical protein GY731_06885 [Gammaproteobacteria bacterium]|nr:hypothetical protein [Gammaproteobacteria bacterium]